MKTIFSAFGGAVVLTEQAGIFTLSLDETIGGGLAKNIVTGSGGLVLNAPTGIQLGEALLNAHLPAAVLPLAEVVEGVANQAIAALE